MLRYVTRLSCISWIFWTCFLVWKSGGPNSSISNIPLIRVSCPWKISGVGWGWGFCFLIEQRRKYLQKTFKGIMILLATSSPKKYQKASSLHCLEVQAVSEVCLKTKRILGQRSVNRDGSQTQLVGNRFKKTKQNKTHTTTDVNREKDDIS